MTLTLLLDLDDTLIGNSMETFIPAYMQALTARLSTYADSKVLSQSLLSATKLMFENNRPDCTLMQVFDDAFYPALGLEKRAVQASIDTFYAVDFPKLESLTQYRPEAVELVKESIHRDYRIGIATNPLFPLTAIKQRLSWAGLPVEKFPFAVVPSYETFHFAKPNPAYFTELIGHLGWPDEPMIMVGNDQEMDIVAAQEAGLSVYWSTDTENNQWIGTGEAPPKGRLEDFLNWLDSETLANLKPVLAAPSAMIAILRSTPAVIANLCESLPLDTWTKHPDTGEWCPTEILCHLRDVEIEVNLPRIERLLQEANPFIAGRDTDPWAVEREYIKQSGPTALRDFTASRIKLLALLENLDSQDWERKARHAIFGPTNLLELVDILARHDRLHLKQIQQTIREIT